MLQFFYYYLLFADQVPIGTSLPTSPGDEYFWQIIATVFGGILLWIVKRDLAKRDKREEKMTEAINTLKTEFAVLSNEVESIMNFIKDR